MEDENKCIQRRIIAWFDDRILYSTVLRVFRSTELAQIQRELRIRPNNRARSVVNHGRDKGRKHVQFRSVKI